MGMGGGVRVRKRMLTSDTRKQMESAMEIDW